MGILFVCVACWVIGFLAFINRNQTKMSGRAMKYPYTLAAKMAQMPWKLYWKNAWVMRYTAYATIITLPLFKVIENAVYSPSNVAKWAEIRRKELEPHH